MRVYLDTNILIKESWPTISVKLREMLILARASQISVVMPEAVEREVKAHWSRDLHERLNRLTKAERDFAETIEGVGLDSGPATEDFFQFESALNKYAEVVEELKSEWSITSAVLPPVPLDSLFQMAIDKQAPFENGGKGFQDTVILLSAIYELMQYPGQPGVLLSDDGIFSQKGTQDLIDQHSVDLKVYRSVGDFIGILKSKLDDHLRQAWEGDERIAVAELWRQKEAIERFIRESFNREPGLLTQYVGSLRGEPGNVRVKTVELQDVTAVFVPQPQPRENGTGDQPVRIAAAVRTLMGVEFPNRTIHNLFNPRSLVIPVELEANATRVGGRYTISEYLRARPTYEPEDGL